MWGWSGRGRKQSRDSLLGPLAFLPVCLCLGLWISKADDEVQLGGGLGRAQQADSAGGAESREDWATLYDLVHFSWFSQERVNIFKNVNSCIKNVQQT